MATAALVDRDLEVGRKIIGELKRAGIPIAVAFWAHVSQISEWQLFIATPLVDSKGPKVAYEQVLSTLDTAGIDLDIPWRRIFLRSPKDPVLKLLEKQTIGATGSVDIMESQNIPRGTPSAYYVTYAPYPSEVVRVLNEPVGDRFVEDTYLYGKTWAVTGVEHLRELLSRLLRLDNGIVDQAIEQLSVRRVASIPNVQLHPRDLRRLRPA